TDEQKSGAKTDKPVQGKLTFRLLLEHVTGDNAQRMSARFQEWIKHRSYATYLDATQGEHVLHPLHQEWNESIINALASSPDGDVLLYRRMDPETAQTLLMMVDRRRPNNETEIAADNEPGTESLHPISPRNFDLTDDHVAYIAEVEGMDTLFVREY